MTGGMGKGKGKQMEAAEDSSLEELPSPTSREPSPFPQPVDTQFYADAYEEDTHQSVHSIDSGEEADPADDGADSRAVHASSPPTPPPPGSIYAGQNRRSTTPNDIPIQERYQSKSDALVKLRMHKNIPRTQDRRRIAPTNEPPRLHSRLEHSRGSVRWDDQPASTPPPPSNLSRLPVSTPNPHPRYMSHPPPSSAASSSPPAPISGHSHQLQSKPIRVQLQVMGAGRTSKNARPLRSGCI